MKQLAPLKRHWPGIIIPGHTGQYWPHYGPRRIGTEYRKTTGYREIDEHPIWEEGPQYAGHDHIEQMPWHRGFELVMRPDGRFSLRRIFTSNFLDGNYDYLN